MVKFLSKIPHDKILRWNDRSMGIDYLKVQQTGFFFKEKNRKKEGHQFEC